MTAPPIVPGGPRRGAPRGDAPQGGGPWPDDLAGDGRRRGSQPQPPPRDGRSWEGITRASLATRPHQPRHRTLPRGLTGELGRLIDTSTQLSGLGHLEQIAQEQAAAAAQGVQPKITVAIPGLVTPVVPSARPEPGGLLRRTWAQRSRLFFFALNGTTVFGFGLVLQVLLVRFAGMGHDLSYVIQTLASVQLSFILSNVVTWRDRRIAILPALLRFNSQQLLITGLGMAGYAGLDRLGMNYIASNVAVTLVLTPVSFVASHKWSMAEREAKATATGGPLPLTIIVLIQVALSLRLIWSNTAFQDEALYIWSGHMELAHWVNGGPAPNFATYFSGSPVVYPPLAALADTFGLAGARLLSLAFMVGATCFLYGTAGRLISRRTAIAAAALFVAFGMTQQLSAFATYDPMAVFLLAAASWLAVRSARRPSEWGLLGSALAMALADAAKYSSALWNPVIIALAALALERGGGGRRAFRAGRLTVYLTAILAGALYLAGHRYVYGIMYTTVSRQIAGNSTAMDVLLVSWGWLGALLAISALGALLSRSDGSRRFILSLVLFAAALLAPLDQARISTTTSLHKHVVFGAWFACIVAGYAVERVSRMDTRPAWGVISVGAASALLFFPGQGQAWSQFHVWPSAAQAVPAMSAAVQQDGCPCLMLANSVANYYLKLAGGDFASVSSTTRDGTNPILTAETGIQRGSYGVIEIDGNELPGDYRAMDTALAHSRFYKQVADVPWPGHPTMPSQVWERVIP